MTGEKESISTFYFPNQSRQKVTLRQIVFSTLIVFLFIPLQTFAQEESDYYEISVYVDMYRVGGIEIPSVLHGREVKLSITDFFNFLRIKNTASPYFDTISGFVLDPQHSEYLISRTANTINYKGKVYQLKEGDLIQTESGLFLDSKYFGEIFDLECTYNYRSLMISLNTTLELPIIREMRLETMRKNIKQLSGEKEADTTLERTYPLFNFGMIDWSVNSTQLVNTKLTSTRVNFGMGAIVAGGETNVVINYYSDQPFTEKQQFYRWRLANNDFRVVKQVLAGKVNPYSTSSIFDPLVGIQLTNSPTSYRRSYGSYTLSDHTNPDWTVELYVNNILIDFTQADASGFFTFEVPLVYGNTEVSLRFYGPWGEEQFRKQNISIPFSFVPKKVLEYRLTGGFVEDISFSKYARGELNYGLARFMTIGGGVEYLSSVRTGSVMPFLNTTISLAGKFLFTGNYTHGVRAKALLNYRFSSGLQFDLQYTKYKEGQEAINYRYLEVRKFTVTMPIRLAKASMFTRLSIDQFVLPSTQYTNANLMLSFAFLGVSMNISTFAIITENSNPYVYSNLSLAFKLPGEIYVRPQCQYDFTNTDFISARIEVEKRIFRDGFLNVSYEENIRSHLRNIQLGLRFDFSFAQLSANVRTGNQHTTIFESARGSIQFGGDVGYVGASNKTGIGRGGVIIIPFLDLNNNGSYDKQEPKVYGIDLRVRGGHIKHNDRDTTIIISGLEPYTNYFIEIGQANFDNIAWSIKNKSLSVAINANQLRKVEVAVSVLGEATGMVYLSDGYKKQGQERIVLLIYNMEGGLVARTLSERDGYFSYLGLAPGSYIIKTDPEQLNKLNMSVDVKEIPFTILQQIDGDFVDDLDFVITPISQ